jgi:hypothetical protein
MPVNYVIRTCLPALLIQNHNQQLLH